MTPRLDQRLGDGFAVRDVENYRSSAPMILQRGIQAPSGRLRPIDQPPGQAQRAASDRLDTDLADDLVAATSRVQRRDVGSTALKPFRRSGQARRSAGEVERRHMRRPPNQRRLQLGSEIRAYIRYPAPGPPHSHFTDPPTAKSAPKPPMSRGMVPAA